MRAITFVRAAAVIGCIVHSAPLVAMTIRTPTPDPWFSVSFEIQTSSLPPGVEFKRDYENAGGFAVYFSNSSPTPLYLVTTPSAPPIWVRDLPANVIPTYMAVSGGTFRMDEPGKWTREPGPGILVQRFLRLPMGTESVKADLAMDAYLGNQKITIAGRYIREWTRPTPTMQSREDRLELSSPLPAPLRINQTRTDPMIVNDGPVPLYTGIVLSEPVGWVAEVPYGFLGMQKLVAGKSYLRDWPPNSRRGLRDDRPSVDGWREALSYETPTALTLTERNFETYVPGFKFQQVYRDNRPRNVPVPELQHFEITTFYGPRRVMISGRILYTLNPKYNPRAGEGPPTCTSCTGSMCDECAKINRARPEAAKPSPKQ
jgi:hypothetical protein